MNTYHYVDDVGNTMKFATAIEAVRTGMSATNTNFVGLEFQMKVRILEAGGQVMLTGNTRNVTLFKVQSNNEPKPSMTMKETFNFHMGYIIRYWYINVPILFVLFYQLFIK